MTKKYRIGIVLLVILLVLTMIAVAIWKRPQGSTGQSIQPVAVISVPTDSVTAQEPPIAMIPITRIVTIADYFKFMDRLVRQYDTVVPYELSEHLLVRANAWLIDTLEHTDYYHQIALGRFILDQRKMTVLQPGDTLRLPGPQEAGALQTKIRNTWLDINLPAYRLRICEGDSILNEFPVRIGKNKKSFLAMAGKPVDLRTRTGTGTIVRINRQPVFYDPVTGEKFTHTKRDDRKTTWMPIIPWIEPSLNGMRYGQMIHPTTNPRTLGKAASNGCIGLKEGDAWRVYYAAPVGTKVVIRYDLMETNRDGDTLRFDDVYHRNDRKKPTGNAVRSEVRPSANALE